MLWRRPQDRPVLLHHLFVLIVATGVLRAANYPAEALRTTLDDLSRLAMVGEEARASYLSTTRKVTNWRKEAARHLDPDVVAAAAAFLEAERPVVSRCVKLNNYWCIKSARWDGEIGTDEEGHVGFASAEAGADAAASLLRRYYLEFGRKSALDIVRRWAPPECGLLTLAGMPLAVRGIGGTVRARYLAGRRVKLTAVPDARARAAAVRRGAPAPRVSVVIPRPMPTFRVPDIAAGMGEQEQSRASPKPAPRPETTASVARPSSGCGSDEQRIQNYAARIVEGLGLKPADDLKLFAPDGMPLANLDPVMAAMSSVELGLLRANAGLVAGAVERAAAKARDGANAAAAEEER